jgi:signal transduction histidine kinase
MNKRTAVIFYILSFYVVVQFIWWGFHIIQLTGELSTESSIVQKRIVMIMGEGAVFILLLIIGIWQIRRSVIRDLKLTERQKNFLLSVTHELKTPLAANKLYLQTVKKRDLNKEQVNELVQKAISENVRLEHMIDNILNASRIESNALQLNKEQFDLNQLIQHVRERMIAIHPSANIVLELPGNFTVFADRFMIETVLINLIENAIKYAGTDAVILVYAGSDGHTFGVRDNGAGVAASDKQEIFKKFYRTGNEETRTQKGSGLGLYIVKQLIQLHGGKVVCEDAPGGGADFKIHI